jgi:hypothetical protein
MPTLHSTIRADTDRLRSSGNNPVLFILKGYTQNLTPGPATNSIALASLQTAAEGTNILLTTEIEEEPIDLRWKISSVGF